MKEVIIIGGGVSGLTCGLNLAENGYRVTILEKETALGGLARSFFIKGNWIPLTYHHVMTTDKLTQAYIKKFGFLKELRWIRSSQSFWYENRIYPLSNLWDICAFSPLDFKSKVRLSLFGLYVWFKKDWDNLRGIDCDKWLNKMVGKKTSELLFQNLMDIKFHLPLSNISTAWLGNRLHQNIRTRSTYGCIESGWQHLFESMAGEVIRRKGKIVKDFEVTKIAANNIEGMDGDTNKVSMSADIIVSTVPPPVLKRVLYLPDKSQSLLENLEYKSIISFICGSSQNLSQYYWSVVLKPNLFFGGFFKHTAICPSAIRDGESIYYFFTYLDTNDPILDYKEENIKNLYLCDIKKLFPDFCLNWYKIFKIKFSQPVFIRNYENPPIELADSIYLAGVYRQFPRPRTMDAAFHSGLETAKYIINKYGKS